jgi:hypothetical protein
LKNKILEQFTGETKTFFEQSGFSISDELARGYRYFDPNRPVDIYHPDSIKAFFGQLIFSLSELTLSEDLQELSNQIANQKKALPERSGNNPVNIDLSANPDLRSELNISAIRKLFQLKTAATVANSNLEIHQREAAFANSICQTHLTPYEYKKLNLELETFDQLPPASPFDFLKELFKVPTRRQLALLLPENTGTAGPHLYNLLKLIDSLGNRYKNLPIQDQELAREMAYVLSENLQRQLSSASDQTGLKSPETNSSHSSNGQNSPSAIPTLLADLNQKYLDLIEAV